MTPLELGGLIVIISAIVIAVSVIGFVAFNRFMHNEKLRGERRDEMLGRPSVEEGQDKERRAP